MEKLLTIVIPVYNTEKYLRKCLNSIITTSCMEKLEILVIIDGSPDNSANIAKEYSKQYPDTITVIEKENGGHGSCCNIGLKKAQGKYIKFLDSDDWLDTDSFPQFISKINDLDVDLIQTNTTKEYQRDNKSIYENRYTDIYNKVIDARTFDYTKQFDFITLANSTFKTTSLRNSGINFTENGMFDDTVLNVLPFKTLNYFYCINLPLYHYLLGRSNQSMSLTNEKSVKHKRHELIKLYDIFISNKSFFSESQIRYLLRHIEGLYNNHFY